MRTADAIGASPLREHLTDAGEKISLNRVVRLMAGVGLEGCPSGMTRRFGGKPGMRSVDVKNRLARDFTANDPDIK